MTLSPFDTTPAQNKLSRHHHDMAWHNTMWDGMTSHDMKTTHARHNMTWHGITLLDITAWHDIWWHGIPEPLRYHASTKQVVKASSWHGMTVHDMTSHDIKTIHGKTWHDMASHCLISLPDMTYDCLTRQGKALQPLHFPHKIWVIQSELTCIIAACGLSQHPALDEDRSRHQTSNLR